jgi:CheY-like chemotaxis protein
VPSGSILIIEDDAATREALIDVLTLSGYQAVGAANGVEALDLLRRPPHPGLVLLDLMMPVMNGMDFRARQLADPELAKLPVVVLSAVDARSAGDLGEPAAFLRKPVELDRLLDTVARFVDGGSRAPSNGA